MLAGGGAETVDKGAGTVGVGIAIVGEDAEIVTEGTEAVAEDAEAVVEVDGDAVMDGWEAETGSELSVAVSKELSSATVLLSSVSL